VGGRLFKDGYLSPAIVQKNLETKESEGKLQKELTRREGKVGGGGGGGGGGFFSVG